MRLSNNFRVPEGLEDVSKYPMLLAELARDRRWSADDIKKLAGGNLIRVMRETERVTLRCDEIERLSKSC
jgi:membrane dipeptidase